MCEDVLGDYPPVRSTMTQLRMNMTAVKSMTPASLEKHSMTMIIMISYPGVLMMWV